MSGLLELTRFTDKWAFGMLDGFLGLFKGHPKLIKKNIKKILIIKLWAIGDSITLLPTISALKKEFPNAKIDVLCSARNRAIFEGHKFINKITDIKETLRDFFFWWVYAPLPKIRKYDLCFDFEPFLNDSAFNSFFIARYRVGFSHGIRSKLYDLKIELNKKQHMVQNYLNFARKIGSKYNTDKLIPLVISGSDKKHISRYLDENKISKNDLVIGISAGVAESVKYRMWPVANFAKLADELVKNCNAKIVFIDSKENKGIIDKIISKMKEKSIIASGIFTVKQSAELIRNCDIFISNDSGMMHVAAAEGTKTIGLFGPNTPVLWKPYGKDNIALFKPKKGCPFMDNSKHELIPKNLTKEQLTCMNAISVEDVMNAVKRIL